MFTGLVEAVGILVQMSGSEKAAALTISKPEIFDDLSIGVSIALNGVCLTVVSYTESEMVFEAVPETMIRTNLGDLKPGSEINLERALKLNDRLGGHFVQGHVDAIGTIINIEQQENAYIYTIAAKPDLMKYVVEKGSICVNGVSLTVADVSVEKFTLWIIPHTYQVTNFHTLEAADKVNLEVDMLAKYIEKLLSARR